MVETGAAVRDLVDERAGRGPKALSLVQGTCLRAFRWQQLRHSAGDRSPLLLARRTATGRGPSERLASVLNDNHVSRLPHAS